MVRPKMWITLVTAIITVTLFISWSIAASQTEEKAQTAAVEPVTEEWIQAIQLKENRTVANVLKDPRIATFTDGRFNTEHEFLPSELTGGATDRLTLQVFGKQSVIGDWNTSYQYTVSDLQEIEVEVKDGVIQSISAKEMPDITQTIEYNGWQKNVIATALEDARVKDLLIGVENTWIMGTYDKVERPGACPYGSCNTVIIGVINGHESMVAMVNNQTSQVVDARYSEGWLK